MTGRLESAYGRDLRVVWPGEDWAEDCLAYLPDAFDNTYDRAVMVAGGGYTVRGWNDSAATLIDPGDTFGHRPQIFSTVDDAIAAVVGDPQVSVLTVDEITAAAAAGMPAGAGLECRVFQRRDSDGAVQAVAWVVWHGGFAELHTWPWNYDGLIEAGRWAVEHHAVDRAGYPIRNAGDLAELADRTGYA